VEEETKNGISIRGGLKFGFAELRPKDSARLGNVVPFCQSPAELWCYSALLFLHAHYNFSCALFQYNPSTLHFLHLLSICSLAFNLASIKIRKSYHYAMNIERIDSWVTSWRDSPVASSFYRYHFRRPSTCPYILHSAIACLPVLGAFIPVPH